MEKFSGRCPECDGQVDFLESKHNIDGERELKYLCDICKILIRVNDETDEMETEDVYE